LARIRINHSSPRQLRLTLRNFWMTNRHWMRRPELKIKVTRTKSTSLVLVARRVRMKPQERTKTRLFK